MIPRKRREPINQFRIGQRTYRLVQATETLIDGEGKEVTHLLRPEEGLMLVSPDIEDGLYLAAIAAMYINASRHERGQPYLTEADELDIAADWEQALRSVHVADDVIARLPKTQARGPLSSVSAPTWSWRNAIGAFVLAGLCAAIGWTLWPASDAAPTVSPTPVRAAPHGWPFAIGNLVADKHVTSFFSFDSPPSAIAAHPTRPAFVVAHDDHTVHLLEPGNSTTVLATTNAPAHWIHFSADGGEVAVSDWYGTVTLIPLNLTSKVVAHRPPGRQVRAYALGNACAIGVRVHTLESVPLGESVAVPEGALNAMPSTSDSDLVAYVLEVGDARLLKVDDADGSTLVSRRLGTQQHLRSFDFSSDKTVGVLFFSDGLLASYTGDGGRASVQHQVGVDRKDETFASVQVAPDGEKAWLYRSGIVEWSLPRLERVAVARVERTVAHPSPFGYRVQPKANGRILMATEIGGVILE